MVEDDEDDYVLIKDLLSEVPGKSFNLEWTHDYDAGIEESESESHDVWLLDYRLGDRNGLDLMRQALANGCKIPMILLT